MDTRFDVALTFPSECRDLVQRLVIELASTLAKERVFCDGLDPASSPEPNSAATVGKIYNDSTLVVVVVGKHEDASTWCGLEYPGIRDLIKPPRATHVMIVRVDEVNVKEVLGVNACVDAVGWSTRDIAKAIIERLKNATIKPPFNVIGADAQPPPHRPMLQDLERALTSGELKDSELGPLVLDALSDQRNLRLAEPYDPAWISAGIRVADYYFRLIQPSAGQRDWQRDFARVATPLLVGVSRSLHRSPDVQALVVRLCEIVARRLRLRLVWPDDTDDANDVRNALYRECLASREVESDSSLVVLQGLTVTGPE